MTGDPARAFRPSAHVLLVTMDGHLLLFRTVEAEHSLPDFWIAPGGRVEAGESYEAAALRELREETGLVADALGPWVWRRRGVFRFNGTTYDTDGRFFLVRVAEAFTPSFASLEAVERAAIHEYRWWSADDVEAARATVFVPRTLGPLLRSLVGGSIPTAPVELSD